MAMIGGIMRGKEPKRFSFALERLGVGNTWNARMDRSGCSLRFARKRPTENKNFRYDTIMTSVLTWHLAPAGTWHSRHRQSNLAGRGATDLGDGQAYL